MLVAFVLAASILLQVTAAFLALRLIRVTGAGRAWTLIAAAVMLMAVRRCITLYRLSSGDLTHPPDLPAELVSLAISGLMVTGIAGIAPVFIAIRKAKDAIENAHDELDRRVAARTAELAAAKRRLEDNVADLHRTDESLRKQQNDLQIILDNSPALIFYTGNDGRLIHGNQALARATGMSQEALKGTRAIELFPSDLAERYHQDDVEVISTGQPKRNMIQRWETPQGTIWLRTDKIPLRNKQGEVEGLLCFAIDVTERRQAEEALKESESRFRAIVDNAVDGILVAEVASHKLTAANQMICQMLGYSREEIGRLTIEDIHPPEDLPFVLRQFERQLNREVSLCENIPVRHKDGSVLYADINAFPVTIGGKDCLAGTFRDVTKSREAEHALRESEERYRIITENITDLVWGGAIDGLEELVRASVATGSRIDADNLLRCWKFTYLSPSVEAILGYSVEEAMKLSVEQLLTPWSYATLRDVFAEELELEQRGTLDPDRRRTVELEYVMRNCETRWCESRMALLRDHHGRVTGAVGSTRDVSERKRFERELSEIASRQQQKMGQELHDGLGQELLGLRLMATSLAKSLQAQELTEAESARELTEALTEAQESVRALIRGIRPVEVDARGLMTGLAELADRTEQLAGIPCIFDCHRPTHLENNHTATQLFYIAKEAVGNAIRHARAEHIQIGLTRDDHQLQLWIRDDGKGIASELDQIAGMGIRIMRHRAAVIGAALTIEPANGGGTLVTCFVPLGRL